MKRTRVDAEMPKRFIQAMIASKQFLATAVSHLDPSLFESTHLRMIAEWCIDYFEAYKDAPGKEIEPLYYAWRDEQDESDGEEAKAVESLLGAISDDYEAAGEMNVPFLLDELGAYLTLRKLDRLKDGLEAEIFTGNGESAVQLIDEFRSTELGHAVAMNPLGDPEIWNQAFEEGYDPLIELPGAAGKFFGTSLSRESLIAVQAPEKRGKTWWCIEFLNRALLQRRKVAFFQVGDLTEGQVLRRLGVRWSGRPMWQSQCGDIKVPKRIVVSKNDDGKPVLDVEYGENVRNFPNPISEKSCQEAVIAFHRRCGTSPEKPNLLISVHPTGSASVADLDGVLSRWEIERDFVPDVIIIDYADILRCANTRLDVRDQTNEIWKALRRMSQERRALLIVPTQANASSYKKNIQTMEQFSEDKRKMAHVTGMIGLNQMEEEKRLGLMRLNWIVLRESPFLVSECLVVAQCLTLGRVMCATYMKGYN